MGSVFIDNADADKSIAKTSDKAGGLGEKLSNGVKTAAKWGAAIGAGALVAGAGMMKMATSSAETTDRIDKLSQKIGMSRQFFQEMDFVASQSGMSVEQLQMGFKTLTNSIDQASKGSGKGAESFKQLGISVLDANGNVKNQETVFNEAIIALQGMEEGTQKAKLANDLFGRSGSEMMPMLNGAVGSIEEMQKQAHDLGLILSDDAVEAGVNFTDTIDQLKRSFQTAVAEIGVKFMPVITKFADYIIGKMPTIQSVAQKVFDVMGNAISIAMGWLSKIGEGIGDLINTAIQWASDNDELLNRIKESFVTMVGGVVDGLQTAVEWIKKIGQFTKENADIIVPAIMAMVAVIVGSMIPAWIASASAAIASAIATAAAFLPVTLVVLAIGAAVAGLAFIWRKWGDDITRITKEVVEWVVDSFNNMKDFISNAVKAIHTYVKENFSLVYDSIKKYLEMGLTIVKSVLDFWKNTFANVMAFLKALVTGDFEGMKNAIKNQMENSSEVLKAIWGAISTFLVGILGNIVKAVSDKFSEVVGKVKEKMNDVLTSISDTFTGALDFVLGIGAKFFEAGANIVGSIADGIKSAVSKVTDAIGGVVSKVRDFLPFSPAKEGPLKDINKLNFGGPISESIKNAIPEVNGMLNKLFDLPDVSVSSSVLPGESQSLSTVSKMGVGTGRKGLDEVNSQYTMTRGSHFDQKMNSLIDAIHSLAIRPQVLKIDGKTIAESSYKHISDMFTRDVRHVSRAMGMDW